MTSLLGLEALLRLLVAAACGAAIGLEREWKGKQAGLRTTILICIGATLFTLLSLSLAEAANVENAEIGLGFRADPARIAAQIVSGIGFLGAGVILRARGQVVGLTTAATIWVVAAIGMAAGFGAYVLAIGTTALVLFVLVPLGWWERRYRKRARSLKRSGGDPHLS